MPQASKHVIFAKNLTAASGETDLARAATQWSFSHFGMVPAGGMRCQLCNTKITRRCVAISNEKMLLLIGADCYDKLLQYQETGRLESVNLSSSNKVSEIRKYMKKNFDKTFLDWFRTQKRVPLRLRETLQLICVLGYAPSVAAAEELAWYYRNHRRFSLRELLSLPDEYRFRAAGKLFPRFVMPKKVTIGGLVRLRETLAKLEKIVIDRVEGGGYFPKSIKLKIIGIKPIGDPLRPSMQAEARLGRYRVRLDLGYDLGLYIQGAWVGEWTVQKAEAFLATAPNRVELTSWIETLNPCSIIFSTPVLESWSKRAQDYPNRQILAAPGPIRCK